MEGSEHERGGRRRLGPRRLFRWSLPVLLAVAAALALQPFLGTPRPPTPPSPEPPSLLSPEAVPPTDIAPEGHLVISSEDDVLLFGGKGRRVLRSLLPGDIVSSIGASPDGSHLLLRTRLGPPGRSPTIRTRLETIRVADGMQETLLDPGPEHSILSAAWGPDGRRIVYLIARVEERLGDEPPRVDLVEPRVCVDDLSADSTDRCHDHPSGADSPRDVALGPEGRRLLLPTPEALVSMDVRTGDATPFVSHDDESLRGSLREVGVGEPDFLGQPTWSASGRFIAAVASLRGRNNMAPLVFDSDGALRSVGRPSGEFAEPMAWSPARDVLAYTRGEAPYRITEAYLLEPSGDDEPLLSSADHVISDVAWSPSGRWLALSRWAPGDDGRPRWQLLVLDTRHRARTLAMELPNVEVLGWVP